MSPVVPSTAKRGRTALLSAAVAAAALLGSACSEASAPAHEHSAKPKIEVRNAFARVQARLNEGCGQSQQTCGEYLESAMENLDFLLRAMRESPKGADYFNSPVKWIEETQKKVSNQSSRDIVKHEAQIVQTLKRVNDWMQHHPEDYR
ncbi:hypothetical protein [Streptomyces sp. WAC 06783]|uniref:hypothetical protein n=1 Tax=Streptomyces sp. WAC 06783 TaxID=2203211 RepID=UPI000F740628|nr:hypothetical protein [Streptomyces sp. WAC 06783]